MSQFAMPVSIQELPDYRVAYLRHIGPYGGPGIPALWEEFTKWSHAQGFMNPPRNMFGISHDNPETTPPDRCRYDACIEVDADFSPSGEISVQTIPGGKYACAEFQGSAADIGPAWKWVCGEWLPQSGYQFDDRLFFEFYPNDINCMPEPGIFVCKICIPVKPR